ncbi:MAG: flagellar hook-associated protein FlgK [Planctomycetes bacterium]|nr:flagellar hook-associated protein FlgK [Planctomycetota bacterium]
MSLFSHLNIGLTALTAQQAAVQTTGQNISNATTPGYTRQRVDLEALRPAAGSGFRQLGAGVTIASVRRVVDLSLEARLRDSTALLGAAGTRSSTFSRLESLFNDATGLGLASSLDGFFTAAETLAAYPADAAARGSLVEEGRALADAFNRTASSIVADRDSLNLQLRAGVDEVNRMASEIARLNADIVAAESGGAAANSANDLRDRRAQLLRELSQKIAVRTVETRTGAVNVLVGSEFLVLEGTSAQVGTAAEVDRGTRIDTPVFTATGTKLQLSGGELAGLVESIRTDIPAFLDDLNDLARAVMFEVNKVQSEGTGLTRFSTLISNFGATGPAPVSTAGTVTGTPGGTTVRAADLVGYPDDIFNGLEFVVRTGVDAGQRRRVLDFDGASGTLLLDRKLDAPLAAGDVFDLTALPFRAQDGSFDLRVTNETTGAVTTFNIEVDLDKSLPLPSDSTIATIAAEINAEAGSLVTATVTADGRLQITANAANLRFNFANDTSDFLAAAGMNSFFSGRDALTIAVDAQLISDPGRLSSGFSNATGDNGSAQALAALRNAKVLLDGSASLEDFYRGLASALGTRTAEAADRAESQGFLESQLEAERERLSGVNLDEEAVNLITHQRAYQAAARFIATVDTLLDTLINGL